MSKHKRINLTIGDREEGRPREQMSEAPTDLKVEELEEPKIAFKLKKKMSIR